MVEFPESTTLASDILQFKKKRGIGYSSVSITKVQLLSVQKTFSVGVHTFWNTLSRVEIRLSPFLQIILLLIIIIILLLNYYLEEQLELQYAHFLGSCPTEYCKIAF